jgi:hypothetical protein
MELLFEIVRLREGPSRCLRVARLIETRQTHRICLLYARAAFGWRALLKLQTLSRKRVIVSRCLRVARLIETGTG